MRNDNRFEDAIKCIDKFLSTSDDTDKDSLQFARNSLYAWKRFLTDMYHLDIPAELCARIVDLVNTRLKGD